MTSPKNEEELRWYIRYPFGVGLIALGIYLSNQPHPFGWVVAGLAIFGVLMMYEALLLIIFAAVCFYFLRALSAVPVTLGTLFWLWLIFHKEKD